MICQALAGVALARVGRSPVEAKVEELVATFTCRPDGEAPYCTAISIDDFRGRIAMDKICGGARAAFVFNALLKSQLDCASGHLFTLKRGLKRQGVECCPKLYYGMFDTGRR